MGALGPRRPAEQGRKDGGQGFCTTGAAESPTLRHTTGLPLPPPQSRRDSVYRPHTHSQADHALREWERRIQASLLRIQHLPAALKVQ